MKIGPGVSELWGVENRPLPLTWPMAYTTACTTVQAWSTISTVTNLIHHQVTDQSLTYFINWILDQWSTVPKARLINNWKLKHCYKSMVIAATCKARRPPRYSRQQQFKHEECHPLVILSSASFSNLHIQQITLRKAALFVPNLLTM